MTLSTFLIITEGQTQGRSFAGSHLLYYHNPLFRPPYLIKRLKKYVADGALFSAQKIPFHQFQQTIFVRSSCKRRSRQRYSSGDF